MYRSKADTLVMDRWTKEVRNSGDRDEPGGHRRLATIEVWVYTRSCRTKMMMFYFVYPLSAISVSDTMKYP